MNKEQFLKIYPQINKNTIEGYMKAMKEQDMPRIHRYTTLILTMSECSNIFEFHVLTQNMELLLEEYNINYRYEDCK